MSRRTPGCVLRAALPALALVLLGGCALPRQITASPPPEIAFGARLLAQGDEQGAQVQFDRAIRNGGGNGTVFLMVLRACQTVGRSDLAVQYGQQALKEAAGLNRIQRAEIHSAMGDCYLRMRDWTRAIEANRAALELDPDNPRFLNNLGYTIAEAPSSAADLQQALEMTTRAVSLARSQRSFFDDRDVGVFLDSVGWVLYRMGRHPEAVRVLQQAADLAPGEPEIHLHLAKAYESQGRYEEALVQAQRALRAAPRSDAVQQAHDEIRGRALAERGAQQGPPSRQAP
ncbi:MAG TPA: tetratricopeptide repeat protein [Chthonomonadales bacterium]|nr:tetratricopeptide repeat protein [Chthonomonadales bacterium]